MLALAQTSFAVILTGGLVVLVLVYFLFLHPKNRFLNNNTPHFKPWPIFGNMIPILLGRVSWNRFASDIYNQFKDSGLGGIFYWNRSVFILTNPELIYKVTTSDSEHFMNHPKSYEVDNILRKDLSNLTGQTWKEMREALTPIFASSQLEKIINLLSKCGQQMNQYLQVKCLDKGKGLLQVNLQDIFDRFSTDAIATSVFNQEIDSFKNPLNDFYQNSLELRNTSTIIQTIKRVIIFILGETLSKFIGIQILNQNQVKYFTNIIKKEIHTKNNQHRADFLQHFLTISNEGNTPLTNDELIVQSILFMFHGHSSTTLTLTLVARQLAQHREIQNKIIKEMDSIWPKDQHITYEMISKMKYLNAVFYECLRHQSPTTFLTRICQFRFHFTCGRNAHTPLPGDIVWIPVHGLHHDTKFYNKPSEMIPERFLDINLEESNRSTFMPFGQGNRKCLGYHYAISKSMIALAYLLRNFELVPPLGIKDSLKDYTFPQELTSSIGLTLRKI